MAKQVEGRKKRSRRPATNPEAREQQLISAAIDLAEQQILDGTASSQVITHFLKLGTMRHKEEMEKLRLDNELTRAKTDSLKRSEHIEELYTEALEAMKRYGGLGDSPNGD